MRSNTTKIRLLIQEAIKPFTGVFPKVSPKSEWVKLSHDLYEELEGNVKPQIEELVRRIDSLVSDADKEFKLQSPSRGSLHMPEFSRLLRLRRIVKEFRDEMRSF